MPISSWTFLALSWAVYRPETPCHSTNQQRRCPAILWFRLCRYLCKCRHSSSNPAPYDPALKLTSESLSTLMYKQHDSHLGFSSGEVGDPTGPPARSLGGSAVMASSVPDQRSEGSRSPAAQASTGATCAIPSFESMSALMVVYIRVGLAELRTGMLPNPVVRVTAGVAWQKNLNSIPNRLAHSQ